MSVARELWREVSQPAVTPGDEAALGALCQAAELWRQDGQYFSAGVAMSEAVRAAWGHPDRMLEAKRAELRDFEHAISSQSPDSPVSLSALYKLQQSLNNLLWLYEVDGPTVEARIRELRSELAQRLLQYFGHDEHADNYLVRGIAIATNLDGLWMVRFPAYEVPLGTEQLGEERVFNIPSAFHLFVADGDWEGAHGIVTSLAGAFSTPGLKGWRAVTLAHAEPQDAVSWFDEAAEWFAADVPPPSSEELKERGGFWSGINFHLWSKYFRARARVVESIRTPERVKELLAKAVESLPGTEAGWRDPEVSRFSLIVNVLAKLASEPLSFSVEEAQDKYQSMLYRPDDETDDDRLVLTFISNAAAAFQGLQTDPASELTRNRLAVALEALAKVPTIGPDVTEAIRPEIGRSAHSVMLGPVRTWMHRALESITDETCLRRVLLRLLQAGLPFYAQVRHGPVEYGKDIAVLLDVDGTVVLRHYQVKCGDIDKKKWRESKDELEEVFLVDVSALQLPVAPQRTEAALLTNGHANPYVEPVIDGWVRSQRETLGRSVDFVHLDKLVDWIAKGRLVSELRLALEGEGIDIGESGRPPAAAALCLGC